MYTSCDFLTVCLVISTLHLPSVLLNLLHRNVLWKQATCIVVFTDVRSFTEEFPHVMPCNILQSNFSRCDVIPIRAGQVGAVAPRGDEKLKIRTETP